MDVKLVIERFLAGEMPIEEFRRLYDEGDEINDFLEEIIEHLRVSGEEVKYPPLPGTDVRRTSGGTVNWLMKPGTYPGKRYGNPYESVRAMLNFELNRTTHNVRTASGAYKFFNEVHEIYYQVNPDVPKTQKYAEAFDFTLDVVPEYLSGGEAEVYIDEHIIPLFPETMTKAARKKAVKAKIKEEFRSDKGYPAWAQGSEWPMGKDGKPAVYAGKKKKGDLVQFFFRDESDEGNIITVEQHY